LLVRMSILTSQLGGRGSFALLLSFTLLYQSSAPYPTPVSIRKPTGKPPLNFGPSDTFQWPRNNQQPIAHA
ncbi:hypothetical protein OF83DRAFT_1138936, partial [Amylostereum chailletii]